MRRYAYLILFLLIAGCAMKAPDLPHAISPLYSLSPLQMASYREAPGLPPELPEGLVNQVVRVEAPGSIPPIGETIPPPHFFIRLPLILQQLPVICGANDKASALFVIMRDSPLQQRVTVNCNPKLVALAQSRAEDMVSRAYFSHTTPEGFTPNQGAVKNGCTLPTYYAVAGNNIESIGLNYQSAADQWAGFLASPGHRTHVLGEDPFYREQIQVGVGYALSSWGIVYTIESTKEC